MIARVGAAAAVAVLLGAVTSALATYGPEARLDIVATPASVTRSTSALSTYASYKLTITSLDHDRLKKFSFKGTVTRRGLDRKGHAVQRRRCELHLVGGRGVAVRDPR